MDGKYNGWTNRATWALNLHATNDPGWLDEWEQIARDARAAAPDDSAVAGKVWTVAEAARFRLAERLRDWTEAFLLGDDGDAFGDDLRSLLIKDALQSWMQDVDYDDLARSWLQRLED